MEEAKKEDKKEEEDENAIVIDSLAHQKRAKTIQPPEPIKAVVVGKISPIKDAESLNEIAKSKMAESDPYCNESTKKPMDKNDVLRDVSSLSSMEAGTNDNKNNGN